MNSNVNPSETNKVRRRYQRISGIYDLMESLIEKQFGIWRSYFWPQVKGPQVLELGVGTGKNIPYYPSKLKITAIDFAPGMLERARERASEMKVDVDLRIGDVQSLEFADNTFDSVVGTFVFCTVPDPILGLKEALRVVKPGGQILLMEHVRSVKPIQGAVMDLISPLVMLAIGTHINRQTVKNVIKAGIKIINVEDLDKGKVFKIIHAIKE
jgi:ubiquinone/menaquinone biosynthesis C-methylase UbiE